MINKVFELDYLRKKQSRIKKKIVRLEKELKKDVLSTKKSRGVRK